MRDEDRIIEQLHALPPDLPDPVDRFEQIHERVRQARRRQTVVGGVAGAAVLALAVPLVTQLLPETADVGPGMGVSQTAAPPEPVTNDEDLRPGGTRVTHLSEPVTITETGTSNVMLGKKPEDATGVMLVLDCLSPGTFTYPDGAAMNCTADDVDRQTSEGGESLNTNSYVMDLAEGADSVEIQAAAGASWRLTATYVSTEITDWGVNARGQTFGVPNNNGEPDLIPVMATNGQPGYASVAEMNAAYGPEPTSPEHALEMQEARAGQLVSVPVYESDGETVIGEFVFGQSVGHDGGDMAESTAVVTAPAAPGDWDMSTATATMSP